MPTMFGLGKRKGAEQNRWAEVQAKLSKLGSLAFFVGDKSGRRFTFEGGSTRMTTNLMGASFSKWTTAVAVCGMVAAGKLSFETKANEVFDWWTKDQKEMKSRITLRHLLTQTSGFSEVGHAMAFSNNPFTVPCLDPGVQSQWSLTDCAKQIYKSAVHDDEPGTVFAYNSYHLQVAMAMAINRSDLSAMDYLQKYLYNASGMNNTWYAGKQNPFAAGGIHSTGDDVDNFLRRLLNYEILPKRIVQEMDKESVQSRGVAIKKGTDFLSFQPYAMGHYASNAYEAGVENNVSLGNADIQSGSGVTGWKTFMDRTSGFYMGTVRFTNIKFSRHANPIQDVLAEVYKAMDIPWPGDAGAGALGGASRRARPAATVPAKPAIPGPPGSTRKGGGLQPHTSGRSRGQVAQVWKQAAAARPVGRSQAVVGRARAGRPRGLKQGGRFQTNRPPPRPVARGRSLRSRGAAVRATRPRMQAPRGGIRPGTRSARKIGRARRSSLLAAQGQASLD